MVNKYQSSTPQSPAMWQCWYPLAALFASASAFVAHVELREANTCSDVLVRTNTWNDGTNEFQDAKLNIQLPQSTQSWTIVLVFDADIADLKVGIFPTHSLDV